MSLFGTSPEASTTAATSSAKSRLSLFDDEPSPAAASKSSLFANDDDDGSTTSPWGMPTPKKASRVELIKKLLPASDVPEDYIDLYDSMLRSDGGAGGKITFSGISKIFNASKISTDDQNQIRGILSTDGQLPELRRNEFNVFLALIGLAQEGDDINLDGIDERRKDLPIPRLNELQATKLDFRELAAKPPQRPMSPPSSSNPPMNPTIRNKNAMDFPESDPWASPAMHQGHAHMSNSQKTNEPSNGAHESVRTTSAFTTASTQETTNTTPANSTNDVPGTPSGTTGWGSYGNESGASFDDPENAGIGADSGFGGLSRPGGGDDVNPTPSRTFGGGRVTGNGVEENIMVSLLPEKEGMFMFQHHNYQVSSTRRGSKVIRRYSDFVWLLDCLQKRYPFRQLPLLPPKRVGVNGNHLAADGTFIEKRRRGLVRFANAIVRHPILNQEQLVVMFLTVPTELANWRKQATISVQEEFVGKNLRPGLEDLLPLTLNDLFEQTRSGVRRSADVYINLCNLLDRLTKRNEGLAADHLRIALALQTLTGATADTYATDTNDVPLVNEGLQATAKHISNSQSLLEDEARAWDLGVLEDMKRQRDSLVSLRDMFDRRDRFDRDNIPFLEKRILRNENNLTELRNKPEGLVKPGEMEKVTDSIIKDKESIVAQHARGVFIRECIRDELVYFQQSQFHVSRWNQDWAQERVKYSELQADNWKQLHEELDGMPIGD